MSAEASLLSIERPASAMPVLSAALSDIKLEKFAQCRAAGMMLGRSAIAAGFSPTSVQSYAWQLEHRPGVMRRIQELQNAAAQALVIDKSVEIRRLFEITQADISEVVRPVIGPCLFCWDDKTMLDALQTFAQREAEMPDFDKPEVTCKRCRGKGTIRTEMLDVNDWPPVIRRMLKSVSTDRHGVTTVEFESRQAAGAELARLSGWIVDKTLNINANFNIDTPREVSAEDAAALIAAL